MLKFFLDSLNSDQGYVFKILSKKLLMDICINAMPSLICYYVSLFSFPCDL